MKMNLEVVENFAGDREKDGVIMRCNSGFMYYHASGDTNLKPIKVAKAYTRAKDGTTLVKTAKVFEPVTVANNQITVTVYPNGEIKIVPNE